MVNTQRAKILTPEKVVKLRYPLPKSWTKAAGLLSYKRRVLESYIKKIRSEWNRHSLPKSK